MYLKEASNFATYMHRAKPEASYEKKGFILFVKLGLNKFLLWISFKQWKMQSV